MFILKSDNGEDVVVNGLAFGPEVQVHHFVTVTNIASADGKIIKLFPADTHLDIQRTQNVGQRTTDTP